MCIYISPICNVEIVFFFVKIIKLGIETIVEEERSFRGSASSGTKRRVEVKEAF